MGISSVVARKQAQVTAIIGFFPADASFSLFCGAFEKFKNLVMTVVYGNFCGSDSLMLAFPNSWSLF